MARGELPTCVRFSNEVGLSSQDSTKSQLRAIVVVLITAQEISNKLQEDHKQLNKCVRIQIVDRLYGKWWAQGIEVT
jgi:hypothetical protein